MSGRAATVFYPRAGVLAGAGSDGKFHLVGERGVPCGCVVHEDRLVWASHPVHGYRVHPPTRGREEWGYSSTTVHWQVSIQPGGGVEPWLVPVKDRCPVSAQYWPRPIYDGSPLGQVRGALVDELGPGCGGCGMAYGWAVDHCVITGRVRGYLCRDCNTQVERCLHISGCGFADYLNDPPAWELGLDYPNHAEVRTRGAAGREKWTRFQAAIQETPTLRAAAPAWL